MRMHDLDLVTVTTGEDKNNNLKNINDTRICIPSSILHDVIRWFHLILGHIRRTNLYRTIQQWFYHPKLNAAIDNSECQVYQRNKWEEDHIDLIGPWKVNVGGREVYFNALTCSHPVTNLVELIQINSKHWWHVLQQF